MENEQQNTKVWVVRHGRQGHEEQTALDKNAISIDWLSSVDFSKVKNREDFKKTVEDAMRDDVGWNQQNKYTQMGAIGQVRNWILEVQQGDIVVLPLKTTGKKNIAVGRVTGKYEFTDKYQFENKKKKRGCYPVEWLQKDVSRENLGKDILASLGAMLTLFQIRHNNIVERFEEIMKTGKDPMQGTETQDKEYAQGVEETPSMSATEQGAIQQIYQQFDGHEFAQLVEEVLQAEGYTTLCSPPGPDGGVDILAGSGTLGFDNPKICVQVKRTQDAMGVDELRKLQGTMQSFGADYGLYVSLGGFKSTTRKEAQSLYFKIRLWDGHEFIKHLYKNYDSLSRETQNQIPDSI